MGTVPVIEFSYTWINRRSTKLPIKGEIVPESWFVLKSSCCNVVIEYISSGIVPVRELKSRSRIRRVDMFPNSVGIVLVRLPRSNWRVSKAVNCPSSVGKDPTRLLFSSSIHTRKYFFTCQMKLFDESFKNPFTKLTHLYSTYEYSHLHHKWFRPIHIHFLGIKSSVCQQRLDW